jgi:hypothetical protein
MRPVKAAGAGSNPTINSAGQPVPPDEPHPEELRGGAVVRWGRDVAFSRTNSWMGRALLSGYAGTAPGPGLSRPLGASGSSATAFGHFLRQPGPVFFPRRGVGVQVIVSDSLPASRSSWCVERSAPPNWPHRGVLVAMDPVSTAMASSFLNCPGVRGGRGGR